MELARVAARAADEGKGNEPIILDVSETVVITDAFVITSAPNTRQVRALAEAIEEAVKEAGGQGPVATEGLADATWILLDFAGFVVHVFLDETRKFYALERLWGDAPIVAWETAGASR